MGSHAVSVYLNFETNNWISIKFGTKLYIRISQANLIFVPIGTTITKVLYQIHT